MRESSLRDRTRSFLQSAGLYHVFTTGVRDAGTPDVLICVHGLFVAIELKTGTKTTKIQDYTIDRVLRSGGVARVVTSIEEIREVLWICGWSGKDPTNEAATYAAESCEDS